MRIVANQAGRLVHELNEAPWGDLLQGIDDVERTLSQLVEATDEYADEWDDLELELPWADEFSVPPNEVARMSTQMKLRYVGRLARSLALLYGEGIWEEGMHCPADLL